MAEETGRKMVRSFFFEGVEITLFLKTLHSETDICHNVLYFETSKGEVRALDHHYQEGTWRHLMDAVIARLRGGYGTSWIMWAESSVVTLIKAFTLEERVKIAKETKVRAEIETKVKEYKTFLLKQAGIEE